MQQDDPNPLPKKSFCRFYLRGLCVYQSHECELSHGVWDLDYDYYVENQYIQWQYNQAKDDIRRNKVKGPRIYKDLYQFQVEKIYTLEELNENRQARHFVRTQMHQQLYQQFMQLLEIKHPDTIFTEEFLLRQFTRVGFNKILFGVLKFTHLLYNLCEVPNSLYFKVNRIVLPDPIKRNIIIRKALWQEIFEYYKKEIIKIAKQSQKPVQENVMKKHLFTIQLPINVPPLNLVLKDLKMTLSQFIAKELGDATDFVKPEASVQIIFKQANAYIKENIGENLISWNDLYTHLTKVLKTNNGNILNQVKPHLVMEHYAFLFFPMAQFLYSSQLSSPCFKELRRQPCKCSFQQPFSKQQLMFETMNFDSELKEGDYFDIDNFQTLMLCAPHILNSKVLGVDLQGNLRKGGFVEMVQLNNGRNTFLFDIWHMNQLADFQTFWLSRKILRNVMVDPKIVKIFHDCRHDSIGLHEMIQTCIVNVFDTSACETLIGQLTKYDNLWKKETKDLLNECKQVIAHCNNVKTPGLNEIFSKYEARHGINKNKAKYHKMWSKGDISLFCKRPLDPDYRDYCIRDVLDLPEVYEKMLKHIPEEAVEMAYWVSQQYAKSGYYEEQKLEKEK